MRMFFKGKGFKILVCILAAVILATGITYAVGRHMAPQSSIGGMLVKPFQELSTFVSEGVNNLFTSFERVDTLQKENNELREKIRGLQSDVVDLDKYKSENDFYSQFLELKKEHNDFTFQSARVLSKDSTGYTGTFAIDSGTVDGVSLNDPVITADGLIGYVTEAGLSHSVVTTLLDPSLNVGAMDSRTRETGVVSGDNSLMEQKLCRLSYLSRNSAVTVGDYCITSGSGGIFPEGLIIGTVTEVDKEDTGVSVYAVVKPTVDFVNIEQVMIITSFNGQTSLESSANQ